MSAASHTEDAITISWLCKLVLKEIQSPALQSLPPDTFQKVAASIGNLRGQGFDGLEASIRDRIIELLSTSSQILVQSRMRKALSEEMPDYSKLTDEEKYVLDGNREADARMEQIISAVRSGRLKLLESIGAKARLKKVIVRFVKPMEQFVGVDMTKYGPYLTEDVAFLPFENARSFIGSGTAVEVQASSSR